MCPKAQFWGPSYSWYLNDIHKAVNTDNLRLFADDTNIFITGHVIHDMARDAAAKLESLGKWFKQNQLTLNLDKTCYTIFCNNRHPPNISLYLDGTKIQQVQTAKYLGVYLDSTLSWTEHIDVVCKRLSKFTSVFHSFSKFITEDMINHLYYAYVYPHIIYALEVYGSAAKCYLSRLQVIQSKLIKLLAGKKYSDSSTALHRHLGILKVEEVYQMNVLVFVYKQQNKKLPNIFDDIFKQNCSMRERITRQDTDIHIKYYKTKFGEKMLQVTGAKLWNKLPVIIRNSSSLGVFKRQVKHHYKWI